MPAESVWRGLAAGDWRAVDCQFTDLAGALKSVLVPAAGFHETLRYGHWFDGSALEGSARAMETDLLLRPDLSTWGEPPWTGPRGERSARVLCDVLTPDGQPFAADPRAVLRRVVQEAAARGLRYTVGCTVELYLFRPAPEAGAPAGRPLDAPGALNPPGAPGDAGRLGDEVLGALQGLRVPALGWHHGAGPGQLALELPDLPVLAAADAVVACKYATRAVVRRRGLRVTFMARPLAGAPPSALRLRQALLGGDGADAMGAPGQEWGLSPAGRAFIAGQISHAPALSAVLAPNVNSYRRAAAPATVRLPRRPGHGPGPLVPLQAELSLADPACNPYLALAAALAAGLDGVDRDLPLTPLPPGEGGDTWPRWAPPLGLPESLGDAIGALEADGVVRAALGVAVVEPLLHARRQEWRGFLGQVTRWELERYFETA